MMGLFENFASRQSGSPAALLLAGALAFLSTVASAQCTNCTTTMGGGYTTHRFQEGTGRFTPPAGVTEVEYLVVGGGGGGGHGDEDGAPGGGDGGDGGEVLRGSLAVTPVQYDIEVGDGGSGGDDDGDEGEDGEASSFASITAAGGDGGGTANGSGGSGGDGADTPGEVAAGDSGGDGGDGLFDPLLSSVYGGGGGGGALDDAGGEGGLGGGGDGGDDGDGSDAADGTGGGGGGGGLEQRGGSNNYDSDQGGDGGSGVVVLRYVTPIPPPLPDAVIEYRMDEEDWDGNPGEVRDASGNSNHGAANDDADTEEGDPVMPGDPGTCRYGTFDGRNDYIQAPGLSDTLNATASLAFWIRTSQDGETLAYEAPGVAGVEESGGEDDIFWGWLDGDGRIGISVGNDFDSKSDDAINDGDWHHIVLTRDHNAGEFKIYIDGELDNSGSIATGVIGNDYSSIGRIEGSGEEFDGDLDELSVYAGILTDSQVLALMQATHPCSTGFCPVGTPKGGLLGEYYDGTSLSGSPVEERPDGPIDFDWGTGDPNLTAVGSDGFSIEWNGYIRVTQADYYRFRTYSDDGVRLWVDDEEIISNWGDHAREPDSGGAYLEEGFYPIRLQYYENGGESVIELEWSDDGDDYSIIPVGSSSLSEGLYYCGSPTADHYRISHSESGITCEGEPVTISAHNADGSYFTPAAGTEVTLATEPGTGTWAGGNLYTFSGTESSFIAYLRQVESATLDIDVSDGVAVEAVPIDPPITFTDIALRFYGDRARSVMPNQVAGIEDPNLVLAVLETDAETGACVARLDDADGQAVNLAYECRDPGTCSANQTLSINGSPSIQAVDAGDPLSYSSVNLDFGSDGFAEIPFQYSDVGRIQLHGQLDLPEEGNDPAITVAGSSSEFVVKPYTLAITSVLSGDVSNPGTTTSGAGFVAADEPFSVRVEGRNAQGEVTPAFGREATPEDVQVAIDELVFPAGGSLGTLTNATAFDPVATAAGFYENTNLSWNQVGSIKLVPSLTDGDYLGAGDLTSVTTSDTIGRFYPYEYQLASASTSDSCGSFSYMGQPAITIDYQVKALGAGGGIVSNYDSGLGYASTTPAYVAENANDGIDRSGRVSVSASGTWSGGQFSLDAAATAGFARLATPDGHYTEVQLGVRMLDALDSRPLAGMDMDPDSVGDCIGSSSCSAAALGNEIEVRFGRLTLRDAFGPETANLPANLTTEYWDGMRWRHNGDDSCTAVAATAIEYDGVSLANSATIPVGSGSTQGAYLDFDGTSVNFLGGEGLGYFTAPGSGNTGSFSMDVALGAAGCNPLTDTSCYPWLKWDWDGVGGYDDALPTATFTFGSYRGHDRIIFWREVLSE